MLQDSKYVVKPDILREYPVSTYGPLFWWPHNACDRIPVAIRLTVYANDVDKNDVHRMYTSLGLRVIDALHNARKMDNRSFCELTDLNLRIINIPNLYVDRFDCTAFLQYNRISHRKRLMLLCNPKSINTCGDMKQFLAIDNPSGFYQLNREACEKALNIVNDNVRWNRLNSLWHREQEFKQEKNDFFQSC